MTITDLQYIKLSEKSSDSDLEWTLLAVGDFCAFERLKNIDINKDKDKKIISGDLQEIIRGADIAIANMEGPICTSSSAITKSGPAILMDARVPFVLKKMGFDLVSLANNHIMDYGANALKSTMEECQQQGLLICGSGSNVCEAMKPVKRIMRGNTRLSIMSFCEREFGVAGDSEPGAAWISHPMALRRVYEEAKTEDVVVVFAHGGVEEVPFSPIQRMVQLRQFVEAGATLVVGHHPHVPQGWELYKDGVIFYSLGNFLFDYPNGARYPKTDWGLVIRAHFFGSVLTEIELVPVEMLSDRSIDKSRENCKMQRCLSYLNRLSSLLNEQDTVVPYWQETAVRLWRTRYRHWLQNAYAFNTRASNDKLHSFFLRLYRKMGSLVRCMNKHKEYITPPDIKDGLLFLNMIRNESHRWTMETALAVLYGDEVDCRTPEVQAEVNELLKWTEE